MTTRVAIYARVSTTNHGQDVGLQTRELRQFAEARGWTIVGEFVDSGVSGSRDRRPQLDVLMDLARRRKVDVILTWKLDRVGPFSETSREQPRGTGSLGRGVRRAP